MKAVSRSQYCTVPSPLDLWENLRYEAEATHRSPKSVVPTCKGGKRMVLTGLSRDFGYLQWPEDVGLTYNLSLHGSCDKFSTLDIHGSRFETFARI